jgi:hypothetical protein
MITSLTPDQANFIAGILSILKYDLPAATDGFSISVNLHDDNYADPIGKFTQEEGAWLFDFLPLPAPKMPTLDEVAQIVFDENPLYYRDRKINHIKETRGRWADLTGTPSSLVDTKRAVENVIQDVALAELRAKLIGDPDAPCYTDYEDRAYAEHRERIAEQGTWFGAPGPLDEEPF